MRISGIVAAFQFCLLAIDPAVAQEPTQADQEQVVAATRLYFIARATADYDPIYALLTDELARYLPRPQTEAQWNGQLADGVDFESFEITGGAWYRDPEGLPAGLYAAVDYRVTSDAVPIGCGFLAWHLSEDGPRLNGIEFNSVAATIYEQIPESDLPGLLTQLGCPQPNGTD